MKLLLNKLGYSLIASYSACVVYTKTIVHLSVGELRWIFT